MGVSDDAETESAPADFSPRATPLERNYSSRLSFVSHNRRSSVADSNASFPRKGSASSAAHSDTALDDASTGSSPPAPNHYGLSTFPKRSTTLKLPSTEEDYFSAKSMAVLDLAASTSSNASVKSAPGSPTKPSRSVSMLQKRRMQSGPLSRPLSQTPMNSSAMVNFNPNYSRRTRSRRNTWVLAGDQLPFSSPVQALSPAADNTSLPNATHNVDPDQRSRAYSLWHSFDANDVLMTPTTEEWRSYGGAIGSNRLKVRRSSMASQLPSSEDAEETSDSSDEESIDGDSPGEASQPSSSSDDAPSGRPVFSALESYSWKIRRPSSLSSDPAIQPLAPHDQSNLDLNKMTSYISPERAASTKIGIGLLVADPVPKTEIPAIPLDPVGPVDPKQYSMITKARNFQSFIVQGAAGEGGYGTVVRARERNAGWTAGPEIIIKLIIKQRILADCWNKHRILGAIPVEIHVLDHIRRIPFSRVLPPLPIDKDPPPTGHPNICVILDIFEDAEHWYLCMAKFGSGSDLFDYVDKKPHGLDIYEARSFFTQIARAITFLHAHGIVHRDIKDENIVLDGEGRVQLIDFGSAAYIKEGRKFDTFSGTLDFAAPEVLRGERYDGRQTDIWALGVLGYVMLCGESPFWTREENAFGLGESTRALAQLKSKIAASSDPKAMADAADLVQKCLEPIPSDRPTAAQLCTHRFVLAQFQGSHPELMAMSWVGRRGWESS